MSHLIFIFAVTSKATSQAFLLELNDVDSFPAWAVGLIVWNNKLRLVEILVL